MFGIEWGAVCRRCVECRPVGARVFCGPVVQGLTPLAIIWRPVGAICMRKCASIRRFFELSQHQARQAAAVGGLDVVGHILAVR